VAPDVQGWNGAVKFCAQGAGVRQIDLQSMQSSRATSGARKYATARPYTGYTTQLRIHLGHAWPSGNSESLGA
jgi:hypothetical protein